MLHIRPLNVYILCNESLAKTVKHSPLEDKTLLRNGVSELLTMFLTLKHYSQHKQSAATPTAMAHV